MKNTYVKEIATALSEKHAALMVGAGFSKNAEKLTVTDKRFLNWNELSDMFYDLIHGDENGGKEYCSSLRLAQEVETSFGRPKLEVILKDAIPDLDYGPSELYKNLMELPWVDVFTTNYDTLLERAADTVTSRRYNVVVSQEDLVNSNDAPRIIKLHGSFPSNRPFIITEEDYRTYPYKFAAFVNTVQQALLENVFCMIGFSCEDPNFVKWIGWIHDNLGRSSSQKLYMISVTSVSKARTKLLSEQNIIVVDLEEMYPSTTVPNRIKFFLDELKTVIDQKSGKDEWFSLSGIRLSIKTDINQKTELLKGLNESYPGWIFLPWKMKSKVKIILGELEIPGNINEYSDEEQISYIYQYLKFSDIAGRPLLLQITSRIFDIINKIDSNGKLNDYRLQYIRLQLLRSFRELAQWDNYTKCRKDIKEDLLKYEDKQFLYACDWWKSLYRFEAEGLADKLDKWVLSKGDLYWPLIKASMYAILADFSKAEEVLATNLILVRRKLFKSLKKEYLSSIEDSCVSLINYVRQSSLINQINFSMQPMEHSINESDLSWWEENDRYCLWVNSKDVEIIDGEIINFDLSTTYTTHLGVNNEKIFYALEYLRFIEQSGHPFRLGNVTNTKGLEGVLNRLAPYYPNWCMIHMLIAQDDKHFDLLFGRIQLSGMSQKEVDDVVDEYEKFLYILLKNVDPSNYYSASSIYEHSSAVILDIIARLCYKCSVVKLDALLDVLLEISRGVSRVNFRGFKKVFKGLFGAYSDEQLRERIGKILMFPMLSDRVYDYIDPICYVSLSIEKQKIELTPETYENVLFEIKKSINKGNAEQKSCAVNRLVFMGQIIALNDSDKNLLFNLLENSNDLEEKEFLYFLKPDCKSQMAMYIFNNTIDSLKNDADNKGSFSGGGSLFGKVFYVLDDIDMDSIDYIRAVDSINKFAYKNCNWALKHAQVNAEERLYASFLLLVRLTIRKNSLTENDRRVVSETLMTFKTYYGDSSLAINLFNNDFIENGEAYDVQKYQDKLWLSDKKSIHLLEGYYESIKESDVSQGRGKTTLDFWNQIFYFSVFKLYGGISELLLPSLKLCCSLLKFKMPKKEELNLLLSVLGQLVNITSLSNVSFENEAIYRFQCRVYACRIAQILYKNGIEDESISNWKETTENKEEFSEIRKIEF